MKELKILVIGDFHGKLPENLVKIAKRKDIDLMITPGDFAGDKEYSKLFFKYVYGTGKQLSDFIGKKKAKRIENRNFNAGISVVKKLNSILRPYA